MDGRTDASHLKSSLSGGLSISSAELTERLSKCSCSLPLDISIAEWRRTRSAVAMVPRGTEGDPSFFQFRPAYWRNTSDGSVFFLVFPRRGNLLASQLTKKKASKLKAPFLPFFPVFPFDLLSTVLLPGASRSQLLLIHTLP